MHYNKELILQFIYIIFNILILHSMLYSYTIHIHMRFKLRTYDEPLFMPDSCTLESSHHLRTPGRCLSSNDW